MENPTTTNAWILEKKVKLKLSKIQRNSWFLAIGWTLVLFGLFLVGKIQQEDQVVEIATAQANAYFGYDYTLRKWAARHGGIYVETSERTTPNPHLSHIPHRDISKPSGESLTLLNGAYIVRQLNEDLAELENVQTRITSLNPIRKENAPDAWERQALERLESGELEVVEAVAENGDEALRFMRPLFVDDKCLKCHAQQGYVEGDLRGGVGVTVPLDLLNSMADKAKNLQMLIHLGLWVLGMLAIFVSSKLLSSGVREHDQMAMELQQAFDSTEAIIENVPFGIFLVGKDKVVRRANKMALKILGRKAEEVVGHICHKNICPAMAGKCPVLDKYQEIDQSPRVALDAGKNPVSILKTVIPFVFQGEEVLLEAFIDISKENRIEKEVEKTVDEIQRFNRLAVGREVRMRELKDEVNDLLRELKRNPRYSTRDQTEIRS